MLLRTFIAALTAILVFATSAPSAHAFNCVEFLQKVTSFKLRGDAWQWWHAALGHYERGREPETKAVLVFDRTAKMIHGHVAVVSKLIDSRTIEIDHANWAIGRIGKGKVTRNVRVQDVSEKNDWTKVRVWNDVANNYGRTYKALGFIYDG